MIETFLFPKNEIAISREQQLIFAVNEVGKIGSEISNESREEIRGGIFAMIRGKVVKILEKLELKNSKREIKSLRSKLDTAEEKLFIEKLRKVVIKEYSDAKKLDN